VTIRSARSSPAATPARPPRPRGAARRVALLEATLKIVAESGADTVTHRRVAEVAGLPLASTTYWFASKDALLTAALELAAERDLARLHGLAAATLRTHPVTAETATEAVIAAVTEPLEEPASRATMMTTYALLLEAARRPVLRALSRRWTDAYLDTMGSLLRLAGSTAPREDARLLLAAADGLALESLAAGDDTDPRPELRRVARALLRDGGGG
jgi:DNA-binding transcriptional regulator YbjK